MLCKLLEHIHAGTSGRGLAAGDSTAASSNSFAICSTVEHELISDFHRTAAIATSLCERLMGSGQSLLLLVTLHRSGKGETEWKLTACWGHRPSRSMADGSESTFRISGCQSDKGFNSTSLASDWARGATSARLAPASPGPQRLPPNPKHAVPASVPAFRHNCFVFPASFLLSYRKTLVNSECIC